MVILTSFYNCLSSISKVILLSSTRSWQLKRNEHYHRLLSGSNSSETAIIYNTFLWFPQIVNLITETNTSVTASQIKLLNVLKLFEMQFRILWASVVV